MKEPEWVDWEALKLLVSHTITIVVATAGFWLTGVAVTAMHEGWVVERWADVESLMLFGVLVWYCRELIVLLWNRRVKLGDTYGLLVA